MRKLVLAAAVGVSLLFGGLNVTPAEAAPVPSPSTPAVSSLAHMPTKKSSPPKVSAATLAKQKSAPKGFPTKTQKSSIITNCGLCYSYAGEMQLGYSPADGAAVSFRVDKPVVIAADNTGHSLAELAIYDNSGNIIEAGWMVDNAGVCGGTTFNPDPCFFTFAWKNNTPLGYNNSGGFVPNNCAPYCPGDTLLPDLGVTRGFAIQHLTAPVSGWWVAYGGVWRGYYPDTIWTGSGITFTQTVNTQVYGEVAVMTEPTETDMGNAVLAGPGLGGLATSYILVNSASAPGWTQPSGPTYPDRWGLYQSSTTGFRFGGPGGNENVDTCSGVGAQPTFGFGAAPYSGGFGAQCLYSNTSGGVPVTPVYNKDGTVTRNVCIPNLGTADGQTTTPIRVQVNTTYVKWFWFRDANCAGASMLTDYGRSVLPTGWTALAHASLMRSSTLNSH